jgi:hypothetical protein
LLSEKELRFRSNENAWNILECLEHLNLYGDFYIPEMRKQILGKNKVSQNSIFKSGMLGEYFANSLKPKEKLNKMKTFKDKDPKLLNLETYIVFSRFIEQQNMLLNILSEAENLDLCNIKTNISITKWIKLKLGDTLRVVIYHNERHIKQAEQIALSNFELKK